MHVLVAEDDRDIGELITHYVQKNGWTVHLTPSGTEALAYARQHAVDLAILDLMLPGMTGLEICRALRAEARTAAIPIIMVTAKAEESDRIVGLELGADDYLAKPFSPNELIARARALLRRTKRTEPEGTLLSYGVGTTHPSAPRPWGCNSGVRCLQSNRISFDLRMTRGYGDAAESSAR